MTKRILDFFKIWVCILCERQDSGQMSVLDWQFDRG